MFIVLSMGLLFIDLFCIQQFFYYIYIKTLYRNQSIFVFIFAHTTQYCFSLSRYAIKFAMFALKDISVNLCICSWQTSVFHIVNSWYFISLLFIIFFHFVMLKCYRQQFLIENTIKWKQEHFFGKGVFSIHKYKTYF